MENLILDAYAIAVGLEYYNNEGIKLLMSGDTVSIDNSNKVIRLDPKVGDYPIGYLGKQDKYYEKGRFILDTLIKDNVYTLHNDDYVFLNGEDTHTFFGNMTFLSQHEGEVLGKVIYADDTLALIHLGSVDLYKLLESYDTDEDDLTIKDIKYDGIKIIPDDSNILFNQMSDDDILSPLFQDTMLKYVDHSKLSIISEDKKIEEEKTQKEGNNKMENIFGKLGFGKCQDERFSLSINGIAVHQKGTDKYVVYNKESNEFVDATDSLLKIKDGLFLLPSMEVKVGDTIVHENKPYFIVDTRNNEIKAVSYDECTQTVLIPKSTMFGIKYFTKVFSMFGDNFAATGEMFSNPMMLMMLMGDNQESDISKIMLLNAMSKGDMNNNPMLMALMMRDDKKTDLSTIMMLSMMNGKDNPFSQKVKKEKEHATKE